MNNSTKASIWIAAVALAASALVIPFEGDKPVGYRDPIGIPTAGVGHTGPEVIVGKFYDEATREGWFEGDMSKAVAIVKKCAPESINRYQAAAFTSFAFNTGRGKKGVKSGFCVLKNGQRPTFLRKAWAGDWTGACNGLLAWDKANGKPLKGLKRRRTAERDMCMTPVITEIASISAKEKLS